MREWVHRPFGLDAVEECQRTVPAMVHSPVMMTANTPLAIHRVGTSARALMLTGHDDSDEARTELRYPGRSLWV